MSDPATRGCSAIADHALPMAPDVLAVIATAEALTGDRERATRWFNDEPISDYGGRTAIDLVAHGHVEAVLAHLEDLGNGANG